MPQLDVSFYKRTIAIILDKKNFKDISCDKL